MEISFLKKYKSKKLNEFYLSSECINLIKTLLKMNNLNIMFVGSSGTGKTSIIQAIIRKYYKCENIFSSEHITYKLFKRTRNTIL